MTDHGYDGDAVPPSLRSAARKLESGIITHSEFDLLRAGEAKHVAAAAKDAELGSDAVRAARSKLQKGLLSEAEFIEVQRGEAREWRKVFDEKYKQYFYKNMRTGETSWTRPFARAQSTGDWSEIWDTRFNCYYYVNNLTKETSWTKPPDFVGGSDSESGGCGGGGGGGGDGGGASNGAGGAARNMYTIDAVPAEASPSKPMHADVLRSAEPPPLAPAPARAPTVTPPAEISASHATRTRGLQLCRQLMDLKHMFDQYDTDGSGDIDIDELAELMRSLRLTPRHAALVDMIRRHDGDGDGVISFPEFVELASAGELPSELTGVLHADDTLGEVQRVFDAIDEDGSGKVDIDELAAWFHACGPS